MYLNEGQYFYHILEAMKAKERPTVAYGLEIGTGGMNYIQEMLNYHHSKNYIVGDWSKFDKYVPAWLIRDTFKMVFRHITKYRVKDVEGKEWPVNPAKTKRRWEAMVNYFINTPVQLSSGERFMPRDHASQISLLRREVHEVRRCTLGIMLHKYH